MDTMQRASQFSVPLKTRPKAPGAVERGREDTISQARRQHQQKKHAPRSTHVAENHTAVPKSETHLVTQLVNDPAEGPRVETGRLVVGVHHAGNHRQHHVQVAAEQVLPVAVPVLRAAADDVDKVPHLKSE